MATIGKRAYAEMFGPTVGDRLRLADTNLVVEVEQDFTLQAGGYGEEVKFGGGKTIRDGMAQSQRTRDGAANGPQAGGAVDTVMTNALIIDHWGIIKADIGLKDGRIVAIGKAGNPDTQPGVDIVIGPGTEVIIRTWQTAHKMKPPFKIMLGLMPKNAGFHTTRSAHLPTSTLPTSWLMPCAIDGLMVYLAM